MSHVATEETAQRLAAPLAKHVQRRRGRLDVDRADRSLALAAGGALAMMGLSRRSLAGLALAVAGGALLARGASQMRASGGDVLAPRRRRVGVTQDRGVHAQRTITINRPIDEVYRFWRNFENLPRFMRHLESVTQADSRRSRWVAKGPMGLQVEWDAEIVEDRENELIRWASLEGSQVATSGVVEFRQGPVGRGTEVRVDLRYDPPAGMLGAAVAKVFGADPDQTMNEDLDKFKALMETGEVPTIEGQPRGTCSSR